MITVFQERPLARKGIFSWVLDGRLDLAGHQWNRRPEQVEPAGTMLE